MYTIKNHKTITTKTPPTGINKVKNLNKQSKTLKTKEFKENNNLKTNSYHQLKTIKK